MRQTDGVSDRGTEAARRLDLGARGEAGGQGGCGMALNALTGGQGEEDGEEQVAQRQSAGWTRGTTGLGAAQRGRYPRTQGGENGRRKCGMARGTLRGSEGKAGGLTPGAHGDGDDWCDGGCRETEANEE